MEESEAADARNTLHILGNGGDNERWRPVQRRAVDGLQGLITRLQSEVEWEIQPIISFALEHSLHPARC